MKFILLSDMHLTSKQPRSRVGSITNDLRKKLKFIFKKAKEYNAHILQAGDLFDSPRDIFALYEFIKIRARYPEVDFYTIYGQHDSYMRNKNVLNNLAILSKASLVKILSKTPIRLEENISLFGSSWKEDIPMPENDKLNILVIHKPIYSEALFKDQEYIRHNTFLEKNKFDLILTGDIHRRLYFSEDFRHIINTGPILRLKITDFETDLGKHQPKMYLYDTSMRANIIPTIEIPCRVKPFDKRFKEEDSDSMFLGEDFYKSLSEQSNELSINQIISKLISEHNNSEAIINLLSNMENRLDFR